MHRIDRVVAFQWGDGKYGKAIYGAHVYLEPVAGGYSVRAAVHIGGYDYLDDLGEIGKAATQAEAREKWGHIEFRPGGLHIGNYLLPRERMESHRWPGRPTCRRKPRGGWPPAGFGRAHGLRELVDSGGGIRFRDVR